MEMVLAHGYSGFAGPARARHIRAASLFARNCPEREERSGNRLPPSPERAAKRQQREEEK